jgi:integrase
MAKVAYRPRRRNGQEKWYWVCDFRDQNGIRRIIQTEFTDKKDERKAKEKLKAYVAQAARDEFVAMSDQRKFADLIPAYDGHIELKVRDFTREDYNSIVRTHIEPFFGHMKLRAIDVPTVEQFLRHMRGKRRKNGQPLAVRTINKALVQLSQMMNYAARISWIRSNPCVHVDKLPQPIGHRRRALDGNVLTHDECQRLYAAAGSQRDRVLFRAAVELGARQGELTGLRWADVDLGAGLVHIRQTCRKRRGNEVKTASSFRTIELSMDLLRQLREWKLACPKAPPGAATRDLVFPNGAGGYEDAHNLLRRDLHPALARAGLKRIRFHDLRHTCASLRLGAGEPATDVAARLGHASTKMTQDVYGHFMPRPGSRGVEASRGNREVATDAEAAPDTRSESVA